MAVQIETLTDQLKHKNYTGVLQATRTIQEQDKTDDLKLVELVARIKTDQSSPMVQHYLSESVGWTYQEPDKLLAERAFIHLLQNEGSPAIRLYNQLGEDNFTAVDFNRLGNAHLINHDFDQALRCYDRAIELEPDEPSHLNNKTMEMTLVDLDLEQIYFIELFFIFCRFLFLLIFQFTLRSIH